MKQKVCYQITFPNKEFYIGQTVNLWHRLHCHFSSKNYIGNRLKLFNLNYSNIMDYVNILYKGHAIGFAHQDYESCMLYINRNNPLLLNKHIPYGLSTRAKNRDFYKEMIEERFPKEVNK